MVYSQFLTLNRMKTLILKTLVDWHTPKLLIPPTEWRFSFSKWRVTQAPGSPTVVPRLLIFNNRWFLPSTAVAQDLFSLAVVKILLSSVVQDSSILSKIAHQPTCAFITFISTYIASCIMTLHTTNFLPFQEGSVNRQRPSSSEILSRNSSDVTQTRWHSDTYSRFTQRQFRCDPDTATFWYLFQIHSETV